MRDEASAIQETLRQDSMYLLEAMQAVYSLIISVNLTKNTYHMLEYDHFHNRSAEAEGVFDALIEIGASTMHPDHQAIFRETFSREAQLAAFAAGEKELALATLQKDDDGGEYRWVYTRVLPVHDPNTDDVLQITLARPDNGIRKMEAERAALEYMRNTQAGGYHRCAVAEGFPFLEISKRFEDIFGYTHEEIKRLFDNKFNNMVHPDDVRLLDENIYRGLEKGERTSARLSYRMRTKERGWIWVKDSTELCHFGGEDFYQGTVLEITEEHALMEELAEKNRQIELVMRSIPGGIVIQKDDAHFTLEYVSEEAASLFGYTPEEFMAFASSWQPEDFAEALEERRACLAHGEDHYVTHYAIPAKDGSLRQVAEYGHLYEEGGERRYYTFLLDVTEERRNLWLLAEQETELRQMERLSVLTMDYTHVFLNDLDSGETELLVSIDATRVKTIYDTGDPHFPYAEMMRRYGEKAVVPEDREEFLAFADEAHIRGELAERSDLFHYYRSLATGQVRYCQIKFTRFDPGEGKHFRIIVGFKDVDEQMRAEKEQRQLLADALAQAEYANRAKTNFLNNMSHDIRTPMNAIMGYTALAATHIDEKERVADYLTKVSHASSHLLSLINDVLDMSRIESGKMHIHEQEASLADIVHNVRNMVQTEIHARQLEFFVDTMDVTEEHIFCDKLRLNQVLLNLLSNAIKFTPPGGQVSLRIIQTAVHEDGTVTYEFHVKDNGIGMSEEFLAHIFEPFVREHSSTMSGVPGTGLGMAITKNIVDMLGGHIAITSEVGKGSEFVVTFPFRLQHAPKKIEIIEQLRGVRGLVVDDDIDSCMSVAKMLRQIGMRSEWSMYGKEAVARAGEAMEMGDPFHVYIIDWLMADMNGVETARRIRRVIGDDVPIIILTAYDWTDIEEEAREAGVTAFLNKPIFLSDLRRVLADACGASEEDDTPAEAAHDYAGMRILLAEDNPLNQEIATEILKEAGFLVEVAENGQAAVEKLAIAGAGHFQLVLMDIQMPIMDGYEAARTIRALGNRDLAAIPIVAMTANAFESDKQEALAAGMDAHVAKPVDVGRLLDTIHPLLSGQIPPRRKAGK